MHVPPELGEQPTGHGGREIDMKEVCIREMPYHAPLNVTTDL